MLRGDTGDDDRMHGRGIGKELMDRMRENFHNEYATPNTTDVPGINYQTGVKPSQLERITYNYEPFEDEAFGR